MLKIPLLGFNIIPDILDRNVFRSPTGFSDLQLAKQRPSGLPTRLLDLQNPLSKDTGVEIRRVEARGSDVDVFVI